MVGLNLIEKSMMKADFTKLIEYSETCFSFIVDMMPTTPTLSVVVHSELSRLQMQADKRRSSFHPRASRSAVSVATTADSPAIGAARGAWEVGASPADWPECVCSRA